LYLNFVHWRFGDLAISAIGWKGGARRASRIFGAGGGGGFPAAARTGRTPGRQVARSPDRQMLIQ
jgi:hypothetical protein